MTISPSRSKDRLSKMLNRVGAWLLGTGQSQPPSDTDEPVELTRQLIALSERSNSLAQNRTLVLDVQPASRAPIRDLNRRTIDSEQYGGANLVTRIRPPSVEASAYPSRATPREVWVYPSSVDPTPVWYRVAGYEDKSQKPQD